MYFLQSSPWKFKFSNFLLFKLKFTKSLMSFLKQKVKVWITLQCKVRSFFYTFFAEILYGIDKSNTSKWKVLELCRFWKETSAFLSNITSLFSVMRHNSPVLSHLNLYMLWSKRAQLSSNFRIVDHSHQN